MDSPGRPSFFLRRDVSDGRTRKSYKTLHLVGRACIENLVLPLLKSLPYPDSDRLMSLEPVS
jgi:hypothetical protein